MVEVVVVLALVLEGPRGRERPLRVVDGGRRRRRGRPRRQVVVAGVVVLVVLAGLVVVPVVHRDLLETRARTTKT